MNLQAIRANKSGFVETDSHLPGPSNFIVDFTFSPLPSVKTASSSSSSSHLPSPSSTVTVWRPNHSRYATNPNTITAIPCRERICDWVSSIPATTICRFPLSQRIAREYLSAVFSLAGNFKMFPFHWITQKSYESVSPPPKNRSSLRM